VLSSSSIELISSNESLNHAKKEEKEEETNQKHNNIFFHKNKAMRNSADHFYTDDGKPLKT